MNELLAIIIIVIVIDVVIVYDIVNLIIADVLFWAQ